MLLDVAYLHAACCVLRVACCMFVLNVAYCMVHVLACCCLLHVAYYMHRFLLHAACVMHVAGKVGKTSFLVTSS